MNVLKFGGTSVGSPERMKSVAKLINSGDRKIVVLSAVSGTTNALVEISDHYYKGFKKEALALIDKLNIYYNDFAEKLFSGTEGLNKGKELVSAHLDDIRNFSKDIFTVHEERVILAKGELLSTALFHFYLEESGIPSVLLPALDFMKIDEDGEPVPHYIEENLNRLLAGIPDAKLIITQGYICRNSFGETDNLKRGGSDYSASLIGAAVKANEIQIWTDIDGMHNNDPRFVSKTFPIAELSFDEAAELAYFGAKILHPSSIIPAKKLNIPVRLLNTMQPEATGTLINSNTTKVNIKAVAAKDGIVAIKIKSGRMLLAYGFLRNIFEIFERFKTPIDMITTSEVAVSLTIDNTKNLAPILEELKNFGNVETDSELSIVCIVGNFHADKPGSAVDVFTALKNIPIRMISYGGSENNISLLIKTEFKTDALNLLNKGLFGL